MALQGADSRGSLSLIPALRMRPLKHSPVSSPSQRGHRTSGTRLLTATEAKSPAVRKVKPVRDEWANSQTARGLGSGNLSAAHSGLPGPLLTELERRHPKGLSGRDGPPGLKASQAGALAGVGLRLPRRGGCAFSELAGGRVCLLQSRPFWMCLFVCFSWSLSLPSHF